MAKNNEPQETTLEIKLRTGLNHSSEADKAETQICHTSYYLSSIFFFTRVALEAESLLNLQTETSAYNPAQFRENLQHLIQIGEGLSEWLPDYANDLRRATESETPAEQPPAESVSDDLAELLSKVVNHPDIPDTLYNKIVDVTFSYGRVEDTTPEFLRGALENLSDEQKYYENKATAPAESPALDLSEVSAEHLQTDDCDEIAEQLSILLKNPNFPTDIYNAIFAGLDDIVNSGDGSSLDEAQKKPEYIRAVLNCARAPSERV